MKKNIEPKEIWITSTEAIELLNIKKQTFFCNRKKGKYNVRLDCNKHKVEYEVQLNSLPEKAQTNYLNNNYCTDVIRAESVRQNEFHEDDEKIGLARHDILTQYLIFVEHSNKKVVEAKKDFINLYNIGVLFPELKTVLGDLNFKSVERWKRKWLKEIKDYRVLIPKHNRNKQSTIIEDESKLLIKYALTPNNKPIRESAREARDHFIMKNFRSIKSLQTYVRWIENFRDKNFDVWTLIREGEKALDDKVIKNIFRDYNKIDVGDVVVADGHTLNFTIINPSTGKYKRMTMILFYDMKSNMPLGWDINITENVQSIAIALYRSIVRLAKYPKVVYLDNGKAFRAKYFQGADLEEAGIVGLFERLGCRVILAKPYNAKAKTVERFFETFGELERRLPTYVGTEISKKPPRMKRNEKMHRRIYDRIMQNTSIDIWTAHNLIAMWFDEYAERKQQGGHLKGKRPIDLFSKGIGSGVNKKELIFLMMEEKNKKVYANGVRLFDKYYWNEELYGLNIKVNVRYDIIDRDVVYVFDTNNSFICSATVDPNVHPAAGPLGTEEDVEELQRQLIKQKQLKKETKLKAQELLQNDMAATINKQVEIAQNANIVQINNSKEDEAKNSSKKKKKNSILNSISVEVLDDSDKKVIFFNNKAVEG